MYIWIGIDVDEQVKNIREKVREQEILSGVEKSNLTLPFHISLKMSFPMEEARAAAVMDAVEAYLRTIKPFEIPVAGIEYHTTITWIRMRENPALDRIHDGLDAMLAERFAACPKISIDYAIMEHASPLVMAESDFEWDDVGNWTAMRSYWPRDAAGNAVSGRFTGLDCRNCIIRSDGKHLIAGIDLDDMIVVQTGDVTLIAPARSNQKIKQLLKDVGQLPDAADLL